jgi:hypothetical protein
MGLRRLHNDIRYLRGKLSLAISHPAKATHKIFVIGSGRSGTHWLGHALDRHPDIQVLFEEPPIFQWIVEMARFPEREAKLFDRLVDRYRSYHALIAPAHLADKSHPNIWLAEKLAQAFPEARFLAIRRKLFGTVASMLKHKGTRRRAENWDRDPKPDRLLGVDRNFIDTYRMMSVEARCAVRVIAHSREIDRLRQTLGETLCVIEYEKLHHQTKVEAARMTELLNLCPAIELPLPQSLSMAKWKHELSESEREHVSEAARKLDAVDLLESD